MGGTLRVALPSEDIDTSSSIAFPEDLPFTPATLDPHLMPFAESLELLRCCLARTLLSTNGRSTEEQGAVLHPDLAEALPTVSPDGLTWTFHLKEGVHYGPPLENVEITSADFVRTFRRMLAPPIFDAGAYEAELFNDVVGAAEYRDGRATTISGLETPDSRTFVIRLLQPAGDLGARLANPWASPIPAHPFRPEAPFGVADGHDDNYGPFLVSSGPYIVEGSEALDFSLPAESQRPAVGLQLGESVVLVRNRSWDRASDRLRPAHPDRIELRDAGTLDSALAQIANGDADVLFNFSNAPNLPVDVVESFRADPTRGHVHVHENDSIRGVLMNTAQPPFDDLHVRKAVALVLNRARLVDLHGGPLAYRVAHHLAPDVLLNNLLVDYRPYATPGDGGDLNAAKAEMRLSKYDADGDGVCDAPACIGVPAIGRQAFMAIGDAVVDDVGRLGIQLDHTVLESTEFFDAIADPTRHIAIATSIAWVKDVISASNYFTFRYHSTERMNDRDGSLVGATQDQLEAWGYGPVDVPNVDARIDACLPLIGKAQFECWAALDQHLMENVVPAVPYTSELTTVISSPDVTEYSFDQLTTVPALDQIVVAR